jgi:multidrug efflux pump subunit AcrB
VKKSTCSTAARFEAVVLVIVVSLIGFWEWGSALLMATSIPVTLARTFGFMQLLFLDIQQVSIALLIIALGLLVDDLVGGRWRAQAGTGAGQEPLGGSLARAGQLSKAILNATIANAVA